MKKLSLLVMVILMLGALAACGNNDSQPAGSNQQGQQNGTNATSALKLAAELEVDAEAIAAATEPITLDIAELKAEPDNEVLAGFDADIQAKLAGWLSEVGEGESLWVNVYVADLENYLSVVIEKQLVPNYGSDAEVYSYVYDRIVNNVMDTDYALAWKTVNDDAIVDAITAYLQPGQKWLSFNVDAFYVDEGEIPVYLITTEVKQEEADNWTYVYVMKDGQILGNLSSIMPEEPGAEA